MAESIKKALKLTKLVSALEKATGNVDAVVKKITGKDVTTVLQELAKKILRSEDPKRTAEFFKAMVRIRPLHTAAKFPFISDELLISIQGLPRLLLKAGKAAFKKKDYPLAEEALVPLAEVRTNSVILPHDCVYKAQKLLGEVYASHHGLEDALTYYRECQGSARMNKNGPLVGRYEELYRNLERKAKKKKSRERTPKDLPHDTLELCPRNTLVLLHYVYNWLVFNGNYVPLTAPAVLAFATVAVGAREANKPRVRRAAMAEQNAFRYSGKRHADFKRWTKKISRAFNKFNALLTILDVPSLMPLDSRPHTVEKSDPDNDKAGYPFPKDFAPAETINALPT